MRLPTRLSRGPLALVGGLALILAACGGGGGASPSAAVSADTGVASPSAAESMAETSPSAAESMAEASPSSEASAGTSPEESGGAVDLAGASFTVGSKEFTEQLILGQMTIQLLENAGATVEDQTGLVGSTVVREALTGGDIDMYWEYTGTGWITHLGNETPVTGAQAQYEAVRDAEVANGIAWLEPAAFNNTYAVAIATERADERGLATISDMATYVNENPDEATICGAAEFLSRDDGLPGVEELYGFQMPEAGRSELELGLIPVSIDAGTDCIFGEVFSTDARVVSLGLTVLQDDKEFFPPYQPSLNVRQEVLDANPALPDVIAPLAQALDDATITALNAKVEIDGEEPADVAAAFLEEKGLLGQ